MHVLSLGFVLNLLKMSNHNISEVQLCYTKMVKYFCEIIM